MADFYGKMTPVEFNDSVTPMDDAMASQILLNGRPQTVITEKEIKQATEILDKYMESNANFQNRVIDDEQWWKLRHWESLRGNRQKTDNDAVAPEPVSAWLFNSILSKHADAMDNIPLPIVLPRERSDEESAKTLSSILPVIMEYNDFEETYSANWWEKLKHGTAVYGIFWDKEKENGLGDIEITSIDLLSIFWEPGITDIQDSRNIFITTLMDNDILEEQYPELKGKLGGSSVDVKQYIYDESIDNSDKSVVIEWYYKRQHPDGRTLLHYVKFVNNTILYATENMDEYRDNGLYDHGMYPLVVDNLFPEKGTPMGFGFVATCKSPQMDIDKLNANVLETSLMNTKRRWFASTSTNINKEQFLDWNEPIVDVEGELSDERLQEFNVRPISGVDPQIIQMKVDEMKETMGNRDFNQGATGAGVTSGAAIAALQEAGNKTSRDIIAASYRAYTKIIAMCIELIRQFYDETRAFRITADNGEYEFIEMNNAAISDQPTEYDMAGNPTMFRRPVFDLKLKALKKSAFSRMEENERAKELYAMGFFQPQRADESLAALSMMDFEGIDKVREQINRNKTLLGIVEQLSMMLGIPPEIVLAGQLPMAPQMGGQMPPVGMNPAEGVMDAQTTRTPYQQRLAKNSEVNINNTRSNARPK